MRTIKKKEKKRNELRFQMDGFVNSVSQHIQLIIYINYAMFIMRIRSYKI